MQARKKMTQSDIQEYYFRCATRTAANSICTMIIALNEEFGFGRERLQRLIDRYRKITRHTNDFQDENQADAYLRRRMEEIGLKEFGDYIMQTHNIKKYQSECKKMNAVSVKEAAEAQKNLLKMKELMNAKSGGIKI